MTTLKVLTKLRFKVRGRTVFLSKQSVDASLCLALPKLWFGTTGYDNATALVKRTQTAFKENKFVLHFYNSCVTEEPIATTRGYTRQRSCASLSQKLCVSTPSYKNYKTRFWPTPRNASLSTSAFLRHLPNFTGSANRVCLPMVGRKLVRAVEISIPLICSDSHTCKRRLRVNTVSDYRVLTLRSSTKLSQPRDKYKIIRPLLDFKRESITMVCKDYKMPVYPDQSNRSVQYSRNRIRKQIIPSIKYFINPRVENSLSKMAELFNKEQLFLYSVLRNTSTKVHL